MGNTQIVVWALAATLLFWTVGAYNRLMRLRNALVASFTAVDEQFRQRHALLLHQADALAASLAEAPELLEPLRAACLQAENACDHARAHPGSAGVITSLRVAEEILGTTRSRLPADVLAGPDLATLNAALAASDTTLAFARRQFNDAVQAYNRAARQFPTWVIASLFGFRPAGLL